MKFLPESKGGQDAIQQAEPKLILKFMRRSYSRATQTHKLENVTYLPLRTGNRGNK